MHTLEILEDNSASMAYAGPPCWHNLGKPVSNDLTPEQMLEAASLDWNVEKLPMYIEVGGELIDTGSRALVRDKDARVLSVVSDTWQPCQNLEAFSFFNDFVASGHMEMHTAGSLKNGEWVWALAKLNEGFDLFGGDLVEGYLLFSNPHQFGKCITIQTTMTRVCCRNTIAVALSENSKYRVKVNHSRAFDGDVVKQVLGISKNHLTSYKEKASFLGSKRYNEEDVVEYFSRVFGVNEKKDEPRLAGKKAMELVDTQPGTEFAPGTFWQLYNATTYFCNFEASRNLDNRAYSLLYGANRDINLKALSTALEMAK